MESECIALSTATHEILHDIATSSFIKIPHVQIDTVSNLSFQTSMSPSKVYEYNNPYNVGYYRDQF